MRNKYPTKGGSKIFPLKFIYWSIYGFQEMYTMYYTQRHSCENLIGSSVTRLFLPCTILSVAQIEMNLINPLIIQYMSS